MAIRPGKRNFVIERRADWPITLRFKDSELNPISLVGRTVKLQAWDKERTTKYADAAITYADRVNGEVDSLVSRVDTASFPDEVFYDVLIIDTDETHEYYLEGILYVSEGYTT